MAPEKIAVIGGGITGLAAAYYLHKFRSARGERQVHLFEAGPRLGGNIVTEHRDGFLLDGGPDSFLRTKPYAVSLCRELGLGSELITTRPEARHVYLVHQGKLELLPAGMALSVPTRVAPMVKTPLLSPWAKLRVFGDLLVEGKSTTDEDESIASFITRRFGAEITHKIAGPLLGGIYAGDIEKLSIWSTFPQLAELEAKHRSLILGILLSQSKGAPSAAGAASSHRVNGNGLKSTPAPQDIIRWLFREQATADSPFYSLKGGMGSLISALAATIPPHTLHVSTAVTRIEKLKAGGFRLEFANKPPMVFEALLIASPAHVAAKLLDDAELKEPLSGIPYASTATVFFGLDRARVQHPLEGVGFIAPKGEAKILAGTWVSSKWEYRAPPGGVLVRAFIGGDRAEIDVAQASDQELEALAFAELERLMGPLGEPRFSRVFRYTRSNPQPVLGHRERLARIRARASELGRVELLGAAYGGVGIPDCVRQAKESAERIASR